MHACASSPTKVPRWLQAAAPSSVAVRPRTAEGKVAHPRRTDNLEMKRFEIGGAILLTRSTSSIFATWHMCTRGPVPPRRRPVPPRRAPPRRRPVPLYLINKRRHGPAPHAARCARLPAPPAPAHAALPLRSPQRCARLPAPASARAAPPLRSPQRCARLLAPAPARAAHPL